MINKITKIVEEECKKVTNFFGYRAWEHHIVHVIKFGKIMAKKLGADTEIVEVAALLHDYAGIKDHKMYDEHHLHGAKEAEKILKQFNYPVEKIKQVQHCIMAHRGSKKVKPETKEAMSLADADSMAHFNSVSSLFYLAFFSHKMNVDEANNWIIKKLERSWHKLSPEAKKIIKNKYQASKTLLGNN